MKKRAIKHDIKKDRCSFFHKVKYFMFASFILSILKIVMVLSGIPFPKPKVVNVSQNIAFFMTELFHPITMMSYAEILVAFIAGYYLVSKCGFKLRYTLLAGASVYISTLLMVLFAPDLFPQDLPLLLKVINYCIIFSINLLLFAAVSFIGGLVASGRARLSKPHHHTAKRRF